ncbi:exocyst complex component EXO70B1-like isoform X1 [Ananas comosus]|uniref:Exocyst subunit Exo70 family protein n=1 Tax=Ananas comosus TaxID=4615 RepID=A0A6P5FU90_ANACO|nr:exocyst complex component EXO70B1-like isoform X1 [Ananas comosus]
MAAAPARVDGQEKVIAAAQHIVKSLATSKNAADDMMRILSGFDHRFSSFSPDLFPHTHSSSAAAAPMEEEEEEEEEEPTPAAVVVEERGGGGEQGGEGEVAFDSEDADEILAAAAAAAERVVLRWESSDAESLIWESPDDAAEYLSAVDELIAFASSASLVLRGLAESALQTAMARLEDEFRHLLIRNTVPLAPDDLHSSLRRLSLSSFPSDDASFAAAAADELEGSPEEDHSHSHNGSHNNMDDRGRISLSADRISSNLVNSDAVADLSEIADRMIRAGYAPELCQVYTAVRRDALLESLAVLGVDKLSIEEVQRIDWTTLDGKMKRWIQTLRVAVRGLLSGERRICNQVLASASASASDPDIVENCFSEATKGLVLQLLNFGDAVAICPRTSEKLFRILGMYEALADVAPDLDTLFTGDSKALISEEAKEILQRLGEAVRGTIMVFANAIRGESSRKPMQAAETHHLTRYSMNYIGLLVEYAATLNSLLENFEGDEGESSESDPNMTPVGRCVLKLITFLESKIEEKSKLYEDGGMQYIFLMNNTYYIVQKVRESELRTLLGDNWIRKHRGLIRQYETSYLRASWTRVLSYLRDDGLGGSGTGRAALKERFKNFNLAIEEIHRAQAAWKVADPQLREELQISVSEKVIPAYRAFVGRFRGQLEGGRNSNRYIKYNPEDLESLVAELFEGSQGLQSNPRRRSN